MELMKAFPNLFTIQIHIRTGKPTTIDFTRRITYSDSIASYSLYQNTLNPSMLGQAYKVEATILQASLYLSYYIFSFKLHMWEVDVSCPVQHLLLPP